MTPPINPVPARLDPASPDSEVLEKLVIDGDLSKLTSAQRLAWYQVRCDAAGLDRRSQPFQYLVLHDKLQLYATKAATDQLIANRKLTVAIVAISNDGSSTTSSKTTSVPATQTMPGMNIGGGTGKAGLVSYAWSWPTGSAAGAHPTVSLPLGDTTVSLTVTHAVNRTASDTVVDEGARIAAMPPALRSASARTSMQPPAAAATVLRGRFTRANG